VNNRKADRWYINICVKKSPQQGPRRTEATKSVSIDLGLKDSASLSDGHVVGSGRHYRKLEAELAKVQRARKKARVRALLHAKIKNSRKDQLHKLSTALVEEYGAFFIGNVNASALAKTRMAKSVLGAG
jgi:putative transposase